MGYTKEEYCRRRYHNTKIWRKGRRIFIKIESLYSELIEKQEYAQAKSIMESAWNLWEYIQRSEATNDSQTYKEMIQKANEFCVQLSSGLSELFCLFLFDENKIMKLQEECDEMSLLLAECEDTK